MLIASASFTPAASSHGALDVVGAAASFTFYNTTAPALSRELIMVRSASILVAGATAVATDWRVFFSTVTQPAAQADDAVFDIATGDRSTFLGFLNCGTTVDYGATQYVETHNINKPLVLTGGLVWARLSNVSAVTTEAVAHTVTLYCEPIKVW